MKCRHVARKSKSSTTRKVKGRRTSARHLERHVGYSLAEAEILSDEDGTINIVSGDDRSSSDEVVCMSEDAVKELQTGSRCSRSVARASSLHRCPSHDIKPSPMAEKGSDTNVRHHPGDGDLGNGDNSTDHTCSSSVRTTPLQCHHQGRYTSQLCTPVSSLPSFFACGFQATALHYSGIDGGEGSGGTDDCSSSSATLDSEAEAEHSTSPLLLDPQQTSLYRLLTGDADAAWSSSTDQGASVVSGASIARLTTAHSAREQTFREGLQDALRGCYVLDDAVIAVEREHPHSCRGTAKDGGVSSPSGPLAPRGVAPLMGDDVFRLESCLLREPSSSSSVSRTAVESSQALRMNLFDSIRPLQVARTGKGEAAKECQTALTETMERLHRSSHLKAAAEHRVEDQKRHLRRMYELPILTDDLVRYAALLIRFRDAALHASATAPHTPSPRQTSSLPLASTTEELPTVSNCPGSGNITPAAAAASRLTGSSLPPVSTASPNWAVLLNYGDTGSLLSQRYPVPLLRTTSFAVVMVRLMKWLRTWNKTMASAAPSFAMSSAEKVPAQGQPSQQQCSASPLLSPRQNEKSRKYGAKQSSEPVFSSSTRSSKSTSHITPDELVAQVRTTEIAAKATEMDSKRASFLRFFGSAAVKPVSVPEKLDQPIDGAIVRDQSKAKVDPPQKQEVLELNREYGQHEVSCPSDGPISSDLTRRMSDHAYQVYCQLWTKVARSGLVPISVALETLTHTSSVLAAVESQPQDVSSPRPGRTDEAPPIPRICASLPFFKEMQAEERVTPLGYTDNGYYQDRFGNRLRSARLAKKDAEQRAQLAAQQRRREKRKGYFSRSDDEVHLATSSPSASASYGLLDSIFTPNQGRRPPRCHGSSATSTSAGGSSTTEDSGSDQDGSHDESGGDVDDAAEITNIAVVSGPTGSGKTAAVYTAAQLLGFRVVEMNTSVRRCSRSVEHLLAELTRSHRLSALRSSNSIVNIEEELSKLKKQHEVMIAKKQAEEAAAEQLAEQRRREARRANGISAQAVATFFSKTPNTPKPNTPPSVSKVSEVAAAMDVDADETELVPDAKVSNPAASPTSSPLAAASAPMRTLLLFEDADVLLGEESAKPFYAAIRDLAHRSKVPIVVTVSSDSAEGQRYDTSAIATMEMTTTAQQRYGHPTSYWDLCDALGWNTTMASLEAEQECLGSTPTGEMAVKDPAPTTSRKDEVAPSSSSPTVTAGAGAVSSSSWSLPRVAHIAMNAALASSFFGGQTPFAVVEAMPRVALFGQLLVIGAVELGIVSLQSTGHSGSDGEKRKHSPPTTVEKLDCSISDADELASAIFVTNPVRFNQLVSLLHRELYGGTAPTTPSSCGDRSRWALADLRSAAQLPALLSRDAAQKTPTDVRFWLNRLQYLILQLSHDVPGNKTAEQSGAPTAGSTVSIGAKRHRDGATAASSPTAEQLLGKQMRRHATTASSEWDVLLGRYNECLLFNQLHCQRQESWLRSAFMSYSEDIVEEMATVNRPIISSSDELSPPTSAGVPPRRRGRPPASLADAAFEVVGENPISRSTNTNNMNSSSNRSPTSTSLASFFSMTPSLGSFSADRGTVAGNFVSSVSPASLHSSNDESDWLLGQKDMVQLQPLRPIDLVMPYGASQRYYEGLAESSSPMALIHIHRQTAPPSTLSQPPGHPKAMERLTSVGALNSEMAETLLPRGCYPTQLERMAVLKRWWRRARRASALRDILVGRSSSTIDDLLGFGVLLAPAAAVAHHCEAQGSKSDRNTG